MSTASTTTPTKAHGSQLDTPEGVPVPETGELPPVLAAVEPPPPVTLNGELLLALELFDSAQLAPMS